MKKDPFCNWRTDLRASIAVYLVAIPLCLGIALASNAPLSAGLISGIVGGLIVGLISGSQISITGPAAGLTIVVASGISELGSFEAFALAVCISGIIQLIFSALRGGVIGNYFPTSVITGMLSAIGIILILKQIPHALGLDFDYMGDESFFQKDGQNTFSGILRALSSFHPGALLISFVSAGVCVFWDNQSRKGKKVFNFVPGALMAVASGLVLNELFKLFLPAYTMGESHLVQVPLKFSDMSFPAWNQLGNLSIYKMALLLAVIGSLESLLAIDATDKLFKTGKATSKNRELFAQGLGNIISGFFGGLPMTAVVVRTSTNVMSGARTRLASILHGFWLLVTVLLIPSFMNHIPLAALASILILVGYRLTRPNIYKKMHKKGWGQFIPFIITIVAILLSNLLVGIIVGMIVGFIFVIRSNMRKAIVTVRDGNQYLIRFYKDVSFLQKSNVVKIFENIEEDSIVYIDGSMDVYIDSDVLDLIEDFCRRAPEQNIKVELKKSKTAMMPMFREGVNG